MDVIHGIWNALWKRFTGPTNLTNTTVHRTNVTTTTAESVQNKKSWTRWFLGEPSWFGMMNNTWINLSHQMTRLKKFEHNSTEETSKKMESIQNKKSWTRWFLGEPGWFGMMNNTWINLQHQLTRRRKSEHNSAEETSKRMELQRYARQILTYLKDILTIVPKSTLCSKTSEYDEKLDMVSRLSRFIRDILDKIYSSMDKILRSRDTDDEEYGTLEAWRQTCDNIRDDQDDPWIWQSVFWKKMKIPRKDQL